jgi:hypothetical protein
MRTVVGAERRGAVRAAQARLIIVVDDASCFQFPGGAGGSGMRCSPTCAVPLLLP